MYIGESYYCSKCMRELSEEGSCPNCGYTPDTTCDSAALPEGTLLSKGRYILGAVLGKGGFGITYAAWDFLLKRPVAIKEYYPDLYQYKRKHPSIAYFLKTPLLLRRAFHEISSNF